MAKESLTVGEDWDLWDKRSLKEPEGAMLCERPVLVLPLPHEEQIHGHGLAVLSPHNTTLAESQLQLFLHLHHFFLSIFIFYYQSVRRVCRKKHCSCVGQRCIKKTTDKTINK